MRLLLGILILYYFHGIESNISIGKYLAKDKGCTFDINRTVKSGFKAGIYLLELIFQKNYLVKVVLTRVFIFKYL